MIDQLFICNERFIGFALRIVTGCYTQQGLPHEWTFMVFPDKSIKMGLGFSVLTLNKIAASSQKKSPGACRRFWVLGSDFQIRRSIGPGAGSCREVGSDLG